MTDRPDILIFPPLASVIAPAVAVGLEFAAPLGILPPVGTMWSTLLGLVICLGAGALAVSASRSFQAAGTNVDPRSPTLIIVRDGPYRFSRNPMYLGMITLQFGLALLFSLDWGILLAPILAIVLHFGVVLREESYLMEKFGDSYADLLRETRRWL